MRLSAYKKSVDQAKKLPTSIPELARYFKADYDPRFAATNAVLIEARKDEHLGHHEFAELVKYTEDRT